MRKYELFLVKDIFELQFTIVNRIFEMNPHMELGDQIPQQRADVRHGKIYKKPSDADIDINMQDLGFTVPHIASLQPEHIVARKVKLTTDDDTFEVFRDLPGKYLHVCNLEFPYYKLLSTYKAGDVVMALDDLYEVSPFTITQEFLDERAYLNFSFATSNGTPEVPEKTNTD